MLGKWLGAFVCLSTAGPVLAEVFPGPYYGEVIRVIDGDTFEAKVEIWPTISATVSIRLKGVDAPEVRRAKCPQERLGAMVAKETLEAILSEEARVRLENVESDSFSGRVVADVFRQKDERGRTLIELMENRDAPLCPWVPGQMDIEWCDNPYPACLN